MNNIVDETYFVTGVQDVMKSAGGVFVARESAYGQPPKVCQTLIGASPLVDPALKIEIKCVAHL
jgi:enamine deaminase RidA (YjgF/YER057c/UK114 family)